MMPSVKVRVLGDPLNPIFIMVERGAQSVSTLGHNAQEFHQQVAAEVSKTCSGFFYYNPRFIKTNFYWL